MHFIKAYLSCLWLLVLCVAVSQSFTDECLETAWPPNPTRSITTYVVDLDEPAHQRWASIAAMYKVQIKDLVDYIKVFVLKISPKLQFLIDLVDTKLPEMADTFPSPYGDEIKGISEASGINLGEVVLYNVFYEIFTLCTSIVAQDENGKMYHGRNLDFGLLLGWDFANDTWALSEKLRPLILQVNFTQNGQVLYKTTTFAGYVGIITGIKPNHFSITMNERYGIQGGYIGLIEWIFNINRQQSFVTFAMRDMLATADTFASAVEYLSKTPLLAPCYYILAGPEAGQGVIITRSRKNADNITLLGKDNSWFLIQTNYDHWKKPPFYDDRVTPATNCMNKYGAQNVTFPSLFNVFSSRPVLNKLTVYTALMELSTGHLESYWQYCEDPCFPW
ncbi:unnamed protein product [Didymodactylos carnosus]|uniref:Acid ceramidase n=1 Tax=Didymodactylos carnosus TaxID=1234261 RepID=A0A813Q026_9BILA|nr:unnamed protein product [Didymodactylos carnosus]CAF0760893.1 unnamed protein product [Didymodactylos carnosus]CAF3513524.1 unnamed protein product [Didymodactylos carnosus]CAF3541759.1 unnamed protein product [Didymodactylos carnosus]